MIHCIGSVFDRESLSTLLAELSGLEFHDGRVTAGWAARRVKNNLQAASTGGSHARITKRVLEALAGNEVLLAAALPRQFSAPLISRYEPGMGYGTHVDDAFMGSPPMRTDLSFTLFLSEPGDYAGGELVIEQADGEHGYKLEAGSLVLYPATTLHRVEPVTSGRRTVVVGWIESLCADPRHREILFDLSRVRMSLAGHPEAVGLVALLNKSYSNLLRLASG
jgi:PKHD-type hydroxylase